MSLASPTNTAVLLSDGTKGRCFGKDVGLTALKNLLPKAREVKERPLNREKTAERREAGEPLQTKNKRQLQISQLEVANIRTQNSSHTCGSCSARS
jgi:hypothetical protein